MLRGGGPGDYVTCENECRPAPPGTAWEMCTCINDMWGFTRHDYNYKTVNQLIFTLTQCAAQGGNFLLNIGPRPDGSVPAPQARRLMAVGDWLKVHGEAIYGTERLRRAFTANGRLTRRDGRVYFHVFYWPGRRYPVARLDAETLGAPIGAAKVKAWLLTTGQRLKTEWDGNRLVLSGLPASPPDRRNTVIVVEATAR